MAASVITEKEGAALKLFKEKISDVIGTLSTEETHDANLVRWLRARDLHVANAEEMIRESMKWRLEKKIQDLTKDELYDEYLLKNMMTKPGGRDRDGTLIFVCPFGRWDMKQMLNEGYKEKMFLHVLKFLEIFQKDLQCFDEGNIQTQVILLFDCDKFSMRQVLSAQVISWIMEFFRMFDANYPERLKAAYVVNVPKIFEIFWPMINKVLSPRTLSKVRVMGGSTEGWRPKLRESIGNTYSLPSDLGGSNTTQYFLHNRFGLKIFSLPRAPAYPAEEFISVTVAPAKKFTREFKLQQGNRLTWNFKTDEYDIGFEITLNGTGMFPYTKVDSHICVQDGLVDATEEGTYSLVFDNSFSRYRAKILHYVIFIGEKNVSKF